MMCKLLFVILLCFCLFGCGNKQPHTTFSTDGEIDKQTLQQMDTEESTDTITEPATEPPSLQEPGFEREWEFTTKYLSVPYNDEQSFVRAISSREELEDFYQESCGVLDLNSVSWLGTDTYTDFLAACVKYDANFFRKNGLVIASVYEPSGSVRHNIRQLYGDRCNVRILADRLCPDVMTTDMALWYWMITVPRDVLEADFTIEITDVPAVWNSKGDLVEIPSRPPALYIESGTQRESVQIANYGWEYKEYADIWTGTSACSIHPLELDRNQHTPVYFAADKVTLDFAFVPDHLQVTVWPDGVMGNSEIAGTEGQIVDGALTLYPGGYLYYISARWDDENGSFYGQCNYYVYIIRSES